MMRSSAGIWSPTSAGWPSNDILDEFEQVLMDVAREVIFANHYSAEEMVATPLKELVTIVVWERPAERGAT